MRTRRLLLQHRYGMSLSTYMVMYDAQGGKCAICKTAPTKYKLGVDHNHETGQIRELLCQRCNMIVGVIEKSGDLVYKVESYLKKHNDSDYR